MLGDQKHLILIKNTSLTVHANRDKSSIGLINRQRVPALISAFLNSGTGSAFLQEVGFDGDGETLGEDVVIQFKLKPRPLIAQAYNVGA